MYCFITIYLHIMYFNLFNGNLALLHQKFINMKIQKLKYENQFYEGRFLHVISLGNSDVFLHFLFNVRCFK